MSNAVEIKYIHIFCIFSQNSIRHNLSLHSKFVRVQNEGNGKSSWWMINPDAKGNKTNRGRSKSLNETGQKVNEKKRGRKKDKLREEGDRPGSPRLSVRNRELNRSSSPGNTSPTSSSSDSLLTVPEEYEYDSPLPFPLNDSFGRPRTSSNASTVSSIGRLSPIPSQDDDEVELQQDTVPSSMHGTMASTPNHAADEITTMMADSMSLRLQSRRIRSNSSPVSNHLTANDRSQGEPALRTSISPVNGYDTGYDSGYLQPIAHHRSPGLSHQRQPNFNGLAISRRQQQFQYEISSVGHDSSSMVSSYAPRDSEMDVQQHHTPINLFQQPSFNNSSCTMNQQTDVPMDSYDQYLYSLVSNPTVPSNSNTLNTSNMNSNINSNMNTNLNTNIHRQQQQQQSMQQQRSHYIGNQLQRVHEKFPSDLELDAFHEELECDMDTIITNELNIGDGGFDFDFEHLVSPMITNTPVTVGELSGRLF